MATFDIGTSIKKPTVVPATAEGFAKMMDDPTVGRTCNELLDLFEEKIARLTEERRVPSAED